jgi:hypothetical protein
MGIRGSAIIELCKKRLNELRSLRLSHARYLLRVVLDGPDEHFQTWMYIVGLISFYSPAVFFCDHVATISAADTTQSAHAQALFSLLVIILQVYQSLLRSNPGDSIPWSRRGANASPPSGGIEVNADDICSFAPQVPNHLLGTSLKSGLSRSEVAKRQRTYGKNEHFQPPRLSLFMLDDHLAEWSTMVFSTDQVKLLA